MTGHMTKILVSNDDGIWSPGIRALAEALEDLGEVLVVAPDVEQSAMSHAITIRRPLRYRKTKIGGLNAYRVDGTPADCIALGLANHGIPDLVVSGINLGLNVGFNVKHSGTVAAAMEGTLHKIPSIAVSLRLKRDIQMDFGPAAQAAVEVSRIVLSGGLPEGTLLNMNVPAGTPKGYKVTRMSVHQYQGSVLRRVDPEGEEYYWMTGDPVADDREGYDWAAIEQDYVSITPLKLDMTDLGHLGDVEKSMRDLVGRVAAQTPG